jgi:hypothetical protein
MLIKLMKSFEYDETGWNCRESQLSNPSWDQIESAVRRLDKFRFPFVWFFLSDQVFEDDVPEFEIMGGAGDYLLCVSAAGYFQRKLLYPEHGDTFIWTSDQGNSAPAKHLCHDLDLVLEAVKYFNTTGGFSPKLIWETDRRIQED